MRWDTLYIFGPLYSFPTVEQWGIAPLVTTNTTKAFFPISFTNTEYIIVATGHIDDDSTAYIRGVLYNHKETNTCVLRTSEAAGPAAEYVAWGR